MDPGAWAECPKVGKRNKKKKKLERASLDTRAAHGHHLSGFSSSCDVDVILSPSPDCYLLQFYLSELCVCLTRESDTRIVSLGVKRQREDLVGREYLM